jgi:Zn-dependent peptidase ImmA (M78 family)
MRNSHFKNKTAYGHSLNKMSDQTYLLRRKVIDIIYQLNKLVSLPRIEVRIVSGGESSNCGYAYMGGRVVHINESHMNKPHFYQVVLHEVLHAVLATEHDDNCDLMSPYVRPLTDERALQIFLTYFKN